MAVVIPSTKQADNLLKDNLDQLPVPPTDLKIRLAPTKYVQ